MTCGGLDDWKDVVNSFPEIESILAWNIRDGRRLIIGEEPWIGSAHRHLLSERTVVALRERGIIFMSQLANPIQGRAWVQSWRQVNTLGILELDQATLSLLFQELNMHKLF